MMELEKDMLAAGNPEFELEQIKGQIEKAENSMGFTYDYGGLLTILCCE